MFRTSIYALSLTASVQANAWSRAKHHSGSEGTPWPPAPSPEPIDIIQLPLPPVAPSNATGACSGDINPWKTGCISQTTGLQVGNFYPGGDHVLAHVAFTGAPAAPDPASIYLGQQVILIKADGSTFSNGDAWKCITCGVPASRNALLAKGSGDYSYPQAFHDGKRILAGTFIISCGDHDLIDDDCTANETSVYQIRLDNQADHSGPGASIRELRLHPDNVHIGLNSFGVTAGGALSQHAYWGRLDFNAAPTAGTPLTTLRFGEFYTSGDQILFNNSAIVIGELRGFSGTGDEITYIGYPVETCNIDVFAVNIHTGHVRRLTTHPGYVDPVEFSPDDSSFVILDTRGTGRTEFMDGIRWLPPVADQITATACSSVRNNGNRRFFQPWLLDRYGDRDGYYGQSLNNAHKGEYGSGEFDDPQWNGQADAWFSPDGTKIVYSQAQAVSPACGGSNPLPCYNSTEEGGRDGRVMLATLSSRRPLPDREAVEPFNDVIPWATAYKPGETAPETSYIKEGQYELKGTYSGYAQIEIVENTAKNAIKTVVVNLFDYSGHAGGVINGYQNISLTTEAVTITKLDWYANVTRTGTDAGCQHTSEDGFHMSIDALTNIFEANGTLTTSVDGVEYDQPQDAT
ncbi:hypothetical protein AMS68_004420 [Peltaster fructicola]|uniref:Saponin hydrolase n=1 Tax=Peltaster fructicola TaxID=286661 RepID=A0A6H0XVX8_9PEZI|nr:hypothetical protein AMS68_004420 [Peltaster fructicola]